MLVTWWHVWLVIWAEKCRAVGKEGTRLWHLLCKQSLSRALYSSRRCCQLNKTSPWGDEVLLSQAWPALSLPSQALCWLQHALTKDIILFLPKKRQSTLIRTFPLPTSQPLVFSSFCCLSTSWQRLLQSNVFGSFLSWDLARQLWPLYC